MDLILFFQFVITLFISGGLFFKESSLKNKTLAIYFLLFSFEILYFLYGTNGFYKIYPQIHGRFYFSLGLLYGPLLFFHFKYVLNKKANFTLKDSLHLVPLVILNLFMLDILLMSDIDRVAYFNSPNNFYGFVMNLNYTRAIHQIIYGLLLIGIFVKTRDKIDVHTKFYLGSLTLIYFATTVVITLFTLFANGWRDFKWYYLLCNTFIFLIGYILYTNPKFFKDLKRKYSNSKLSESDLNSLKQKIELFFQKEKPELDSTFNVEILAKSIQSNTNYVSQTFSKTIKESFKDYVNRKRIDYSKLLLKNEKYNHLKIEAIAKEAGFNNKVTFYKAFSKFENTTPSIYRKS